MNVVFVIVVGMVMGWIVAVMAHDYFDAALPIIDNDD